MASISFQLEGLDRALAWLDADLEHIKHGVEAGLYRRSLSVMAASQDIAPIGGPPTSPNDKTPGELRASGTVHLPEWDGSVCSVTMGYGGAAAAYAERQHEDLLLRHKSGQQAKFLERPLMDQQNDVLGDIVDAIQEERA